MILSNNIYTVTINSPFLSEMLSPKINVLCDGVNLKDRRKTIYSRYYYFIDVETRGVFEFLA